MRRSGAVDPATGFNRVFITAGFTFLDVTGQVLGAPARAERYFEADIDIRRETGKVERPPFMELKNTSEGDQGRIHFTKTTVVP